MNNRTNIFRAVNESKVALKELTREQEGLIILLELYKLELIPLCETLFLAVTKA